MSTELNDSVIAQQTLLDAKVWRKDDALRRLKSFAEFTRDNNMNVSFHNDHSIGYSDGYNNKGQYMAKEILEIIASIDK